MNSILRKRNVCKKFRSGLLLFAFSFLNVAYMMYNFLSNSALISVKNELLTEHNNFDLEDGITDEVKKYIEELGLKNPGENGEPIILPENTSVEIKKLIDEGKEKFGFNVFISNMISLNRNIPDFRSEICKNKTYHENLPKISIVIPFHNEEWMLLMRTLHSILLRSPLKYVEEILLIDDASDKE
ncbi:CLUMA_CG015358, isoform A [Clunio marinus]|uniref:CLUMA_CG015358, isoform A n=1 Tax=Clunio marinus TaxID=568069 RepID=A0A1J1ITS8_9DIPT|nr:CLUMA_CG015358, isoform A [Clunio marinus]